MSDDHPVFNTFDRGREIEIRERNLPHWFQPGSAIFVTFRTADSLPKDVVLKMQNELEEWLRVRGLPEEFALSSISQRRADHNRLRRAFSPRDIQEFRKLVARLIHWSLDECHGKCVLRQPQLADIVANAIRHGDGSQFDLDRFVIMPNHVHAIVQFRNGFDLSVVGQSWMRYSARLINRRIGESGAFWQPEPFDHIVRSAEQFHWLQNYVADNPQKAKLRDGEFVLWTRDGL
jgi:REP element-mobilizing transposase RayT